MRMLGTVVGFAALLALGCASHTGFVTRRHDEAKEIALSAGRGALDCPEASAQVISTTSQAVGTVETVVYVVQVSGCGTHAFYSVGCPKDADACGPAVPTTLK